MDIDLYKKARVAKDRNFDGKFFFAVQTTGIFCRPSCPAPVANEENVVYLNNMFEALDQGFRPCLRCRPDLVLDYYKGNPAGSRTVQEGLRLIYDGYLHEHSVAELADRLHISERHLRKLFMDMIGQSPGKIDRYHKLVFAKKLLAYSSQAITDVAFAAGFGSLRQFNDMFKRAFRMTPSSYRKSVGETQPVSVGSTLRIQYVKPFDFSPILEFLRPRAIAGVEVVTGKSYGRTFRTETSSGYFTVTDNPGKSCLELSINCDDLRCYMTIYNRVRKMFDVDTDFSTINTQLRSDPVLLRGMVEGHVPRLPVAYDPFEFVVRAVLGQQISIKAATTLAGRIAAKADIPASTYFPQGFTHLFPNAEEFCGLDLSDLGITRTRQKTLHRVIDALLDGRFDLSSHQSFELFHQNFTAIKGVGDWTAHYVAMRGLGMMDCFPYSDLGIIRVLSINGKEPTRKELMMQSERWRPYRSYATLCLWNLYKKENM